MSPEEIENLEKLEKENQILKNSLKLILGSLKERSEYFHKLSKIGIESKTFNYVEMNFKSTYDIFSFLEKYC